MESLALYDKWSTQILVYFTVFLFATAAAVLLDTGLHVSRVTVLLYVLPTTALLMFVVPMIYAYLVRLAVREFLPTELFANAKLAVQPEASEPFDRQQASRELAELQLQLEELISKLTKKNAKSNRSRTPFTASGTNLRRNLYGGRLSR